MQVTGDTGYVLTLKCYLCLDRSNDGFGWSLAPGGWRPQVTFRNVLSLFPVLAMPYTEAVGSGLRLLACKGGAAL